jgi:hypothetical protein
VKRSTTARSDERRRRASWPRPRRLRRRQAKQRRRAGPAMGGHDVAGIPVDPVKDESDEQAKRMVSS